MATIKPELKTILDRYGIDPRDTSQIWDCRGTLVLYHKAYEIIAARESIAFDPPTIIRGEKDEAVVLVSGKMGDRCEWSFGEAAIGQNYQVSGKQAAYPYAMAEKRGKDRVIGKLVGLAQYVYSEDEAAEFKEERKPAPVADTSHWVEWIETFRGAFTDTKSYLESKSLWNDNKDLLANLKAQAPALYDELANWCRSEGKNKPQEAC